MSGKKRNNSATDTELQANVPSKKLSSADTTAIKKSRATTATGEAADGSKRMPKKKDDDSLIGVATGTKAASNDGAMAPAHDDDASLPK